MFYFAMRCIMYLIGLLCQILSHAHKICKKGRIFMQKRFFSILTVLFLLFVLSPNTVLAIGNNDGSSIEHAVSVQNEQELNDAIKAAPKDKDYYIRIAGTSGTTVFTLSSKVEIPENTKLHIVADCDITPVDDWNPEQAVFYVKGNLTLEGTIKNFKCTFAPIVIDGNGSLTCHTTLFNCQGNISLFFIYAAGELTFDFGNYILSNPGNHTDIYNQGSVTLTGSTLIAGDILNTGTIYANAGTLAGDITNSGNITGSGGTNFTGASCCIQNTGTIQAGNFAVKVNNESSGKITGGTFSGIVNNECGIVSGGDFSAASSISGIYTVTFDTNGGTSAAPATQWRANADATEPAAPSKTSSSFLGWWKANSSDADFWTFANNPITANLNLTAYWHDHNWSSWSNNDTHHWKNCTNASCPISADSDKNSYGTHLYTLQIPNDTYKVSDANCTTPATYYKSCICGKAGTATFTVGSANGHSYKYSSNENKITETCTHMGCNHSETATVSPPTGSLIYDGTSFNANISYSEEWSGGALDISYQKNNVPTTDTADAGSYTAVITKTNDIGTVLATAASHYTVSPAALTDISVVQAEKLTYNGSAQTATVTATATAVNNQEVTFTYSTTTSGIYGAMPSFINAGNHTVYYKASAANHIDAAGSFSVKIAPAALTDISVVQAEKLTYNGSTQTAAVTATATAVNNQEVTFTYSTTTSGIYGAMPSFINAGNHTVYYKASAANHNDEAGCFTVYIDRAIVTIKAIDKSAYVGSDIPDFSTPVPGKDYTITGLFGDDSVTVTLTCTPDMNKTGYYDINPDVAGEDTRYTFLLERGTLTVSRRPSNTYSVNTPSKTENGSVTVHPQNAKKGTIVTITITPDNGYKLKSLTVLDKNGNKIDLTSNGNSQYTFTMPSSKVNIQASFTEDNAVSSCFEDVHANMYFHDAVLWAINNGITTGMDDEHYAPNLNCTRGQLVTFIWRATGCPKSNSTSGFTDIAADAYYAEAVAWAVENRITTGIDNNRFCPDAPCARAQAVTFLWRAAGCPKPNGTSSFTDVVADAYYAEAVAWAVENNITTGIDNNCFCPDIPCTRAQIITFLYRSFK